MSASSPAAKPVPAADPVVEKLMDGHYDRQLAAFEARIEEAAATLRRAHAAMKAENTLRS
ncbi:hypothetical protein [Phenylobacterium sp. SCN 70-31]|uniref:hypothetical protein n=1 Tax=Phenylobacterium sp. SCN 70-31 TaxID=1660129 RepID=UPI0025F6008A|nr:hypothetical protein [Phenylobacterium sp. SCN 70-31]